MPFFGPMPLGGGDAFANVPPVDPRGNPGDPGAYATSPYMPVSSPPPLNATQPPSSTSPITNQPPLAFAGPTSGRAESITAQIGGDSHSPISAVDTTPGGPTGSSAGSTVTGPTVSGLNAEGISPMGHITSIGANTLGAQLGANIGLSPTISNMGIGLLGQLAGFPLGVINAITGLVNHFGLLNDLTVPAETSPVTIATQNALNPEIGNNPNVNVDTSVNSAPATDPTATPGMEFSENPQGIAAPVGAVATGPDAGGPNVGSNVDAGPDASPSVSSDASNAGDIGDW